ncbi:MAG: MBL fold metallo-hydrolase [Verrucomicrobia bacterium]|nr:MBL fold metallo-hydrolase [Verrucomicrobiota bacterium]
MTAIRRSWRLLPAFSRRDLRYLRLLWAEAKRPIVPAPVRPQPGAWPSKGITACWLGHSTVLLNFDGVTILTDPVLGSRIGIRAGPVVIGMKRLVAPALKARELPHIDLVLLSHAHMDHFDRGTLAQLGARFARRGVQVVTAHATSDLLRGTRLQRVARELRWGERATLEFSDDRGELEIEAIEVRHWGARLRTDNHRGYCGYLLRRNGRAVLFAGDTAYAPEAFARLRRPGGYDLALVPIGTYDPWIANHCTPEQAVRMADLAGARVLLPIHHQTFKLSREPFDEPLRRFEAALAKTPERIALRRIGETFRLE